ncbi:stage III sporulation protein AE [Psychrobacillus antarcticus]|uniref:stage III sporulation protein AE n=1 Tax=Psychrobacillus antarcticus TaxID=2879115 RepID=UPI0024081E22|nr:stage III sporulation protein AE [Psychrobacillus antarcticus]
MEEILKSLVQPVKEVAQTFSYMLLFGFIFICLEWFIPSSKRLFKLMFMLIICIYCLEPAIRALQLIQSMTSELVTLFLSIYPILTLGIAASGGAFLITSWNPAVMLFASFTTVLAGKILIPAIMAAFIFDLISRIHPPTSFAKMSDLIRLTLIGSTSIILLLYSIFMSVNGVITWAVSGTVNETVKRLIQNNIPIVGSLLTESISTMKNFSSSASVITGNAVIISLLVLVAIPTIQTILIAFLYRLLGAILEPFVDGNISGLLDDIGKTLFVLSIISVLIAFTFFFTIILTMLFAKLLITGKG